MSQQGGLLTALRCWPRITTFKREAESASQGPQQRAKHSVVAGAKDALAKLCLACRTELPEAILAFADAVEITSASGKGDEVHFPCPLREQEAVTAIKALEACAAAAIAQLRYGMESKKIRIDVDRVSAFLMSAYLTTLDGMDKADPRIRERIPDTDLNQAQSVLYRRMSANLYRTKNRGEYYHIHGSLDADVTLEMLGLPKNNPSMTDYRSIIDYIESAVMQHSAAELDSLNVAHRQAGIQALTWAQFKATSHGKALLQLPPFTPSALHGIKVLELCRIIAGPTIGRSLAAHGAKVLKVTAPHLPDVPFFQLDVNTGKHAIHLDLRNSAADRATFDALLADADVLIDGYRPGALARLGYGPSQLAALAARRGRAFVYVAEDCFGGTGRPGAEWAARRGWQQIADCATGVAWAQGAFMMSDQDRDQDQQEPEPEPVVPPFPMSDYGTGALGSLAALAGLYRRATADHSQGGGSSSSFSSRPVWVWECRTSLCQYDAFLLGLGLLPAGERARLRRAHDNEAGFFALRHSDSVDEVGRRALASMRIAVPYLFDERRMMCEAWSEGFGGWIRWPKEAVQIDGLRVGHVRAARPNGWDKVASWDGWEEEEIGEVRGMQEGEETEKVAPVLAGR
ncbi:77fa5a5c-196a-474c-9865-0bd20da78203 [Thermothielavioides terrestris]|uniref:77fa5a5c-196a-474c-9865-0bd20da78203 n=1 Tax=Thermothielavioides terrestris TaxID=2587410 RepID=A0A446BIL6_9PEZI|nr:77fa5a5c-196a-474c-9865-0bd20da78203 [Thermothielavioides terrestris]